ncbi:MAG: chemotaxis protein CheX [Paraburkholderia sp.]|uniref:chemotaxis protein CheX n=1 Tax=Burkholderiaceae TaxID=119060 RepID=UPI0010F43790|nr:chemotaxis protein CheX [Burkholderia sp. 4M9327F10]
MNENKPVSKVLVLEDCPAHVEAIRNFCDENNLVGLKVSKSRLASALRSNFDLGAILVSESYGGSIEESTAIALRIHAERPELPIIIRRESSAARDGLPEALDAVVCGAYVASDPASLRKVIDEYIFNREYPNALVRGIAELTSTVLSGLFSDLSVETDAPCIVRDRVIFGEVFSLIPLESSWCRGYMMIQAAEQPILDLLSRREMAEGAADFRDLNSLLGELTNMIWGAFRNRYVGDANGLSHSQVQVPLLINHKQKYISFGSESPHLCFTYRLTDEQSGRVVKLHQRFAFSLSWSPEDFQEFEQSADDSVGAGELDLF